MAWECLGPIPGYGWGYCPPPPPLPPVQVSWDSVEEWKIELEPPLAGLRASSWLWETQRNLWVVVTAVYQWCSWARATWRSLGTGRDLGVPQDWESLATEEKVVAAWERIVAAQTFLTVSSSLSVPGAG